MYNKLCNYCKGNFKTQSRQKMYCSELCKQRKDRNIYTRTYKCLWCGKENSLLGRGMDKAKFCSETCREEWHSFMDSRSPFFDKNRTKQNVLSNPALYVKCEICGKLARRRLSTHIKKAHLLNWKQYIKLYPNAKNECSQITMFAYEHMKKDGRIIKRDDGLRCWEAIRKRKSKQKNYMCELCGYNKYKEAICAHHILPKFLGGKDDYDNCILVCENCHRHIHTLIRKVITNKNYTIQDIVRTCLKKQEANSKN